MTCRSRREMLKSGALITLGIALSYIKNDRIKAERMRIQAEDPLLTLSLRESAARIRSGELSAAELAEAVISAAGELADLNAYTSFEPDLLRRQAQAADAAVKRGASTGPLHGVPLIIKDNINTAALPTSGGTPGLRGNKPGVDSPVAARLFAAGALLGGKANLHELSTGGTSNNLTYGAVGNPYDPGRVPGGSSGGTAAAVAAHMIAGGLGTDTGGSVRVPAALCGVVGLRPSTGRYPSGGIVPLSSTLDTAGPIARNVADVALLDAVLAGDASPGDVPEPDTLRLGVPGDELLAGTDEAIMQNYQDVLTALRANGVALIPVDLSAIRELTPKIIGALIGFEFRDALAEYLEKFAPQLDIDELVDQIASPSIKPMLAKRNARTAGNPKYRQMLDEVKPELTRRHQRLFKSQQLDALIFPSTPQIALPRHDDNSIMLNGRPVVSFLYFTHSSLASAAGNPSLTLPSGLTTGGLPTGICIDGLPGADDRILSIGRSIEKVLG